MPGGPVASNGDVPLRSEARPDVGARPTPGHVVSRPSRPGASAVTPGRLVQRPTPATHGGSVRGATRPYDRTRATAAHHRPPHRSYDHRYARPDYRAVRPHPRAYAPPPKRVYYRPYYTRWWVHPYYRHTYSTTVVVSFGFNSSPWTPSWAPPARPGWAWIPGVWVGTVWTPGYWAPVGNAPASYVYVPGFWDGTVYVDGFYRPAQRTDGAWVWIDGYYLEDGTFVRGHWRPAKPGPQGYAWEAGFWDGETWIDGFWRPEFRNGFTWVSSYYDDAGIFHGGYWAPLQQLEGHVWVPGWFDGNQWVEGYWVRDAEYVSEDVQNWQPEQGWHEGWEPGEWDRGSPDNQWYEQRYEQPGRIESTQLAPPAEAAPHPGQRANGDELPLGLPVDVGVEDL